MIPESSTSSETRSFLSPFTPVVLAVALLWSCPALAIHNESHREIAIGDVLPKATRQTVQNNAITIPANDGITVLLFWSTWSPRSRQALELWEKFSADYPEQPLTIIAINSERDELSSQELQSIKQYIVENVSSLPVVMDDGLDLFNTYAVIALPTAFFMNSTGRVLYRYPSFPTSAPLDLQEELEITLGLRTRQTEEEEASRGKLEYQPKNNALLHYNMAVQLYKKGYREKALGRMVIALQKDPAYKDPMRTLEGIFFGDGRTPEDETRLKAFLMENGLDDQMDRIGEGEPILIEAPKKVDAMERMRQLMEKNKPSIETSQ